MRSTSSVGVWLVLVTLMLSTGLRGLGSLLSLGVAVSLVGTLDGRGIGFAAGAIGISVSAIGAVLLVWVVLRVAPREPSILVTVLALAAGVFGWASSYGANVVSNWWVGKLGSEAMVAYFGAVMPLWLVSSSLDHGGWVVASILAHVQARGVSGPDAAAGSGSPAPRA